MRVIRVTTDIEFSCCGKFQHARVENSGSDINATIKCSECDNLVVYNRDQVLRGIRFEVKDL